MPYVRSRKFCCCLPVRFGVFCEALLGLGLGGFAAIAAFLSIQQVMAGKLPDVSHDELIALWIVAVTMTLFAFTGLMGLIGSIGRIRGLVSLYASVITFVTVANVVGGIYVIYQLFHAAGAEQVAKCEADAQGGKTDVNHFVCDEGFKVGRTVAIVVYVIFWLIEIYGCFIAFWYVSQLTEEKDAELLASAAEKQTAANVTVVAQPAYAFSQTPNAYAPPTTTYGEYPASRV
ncbi:uncharacterized protein BXZ73DRAFT_52563 [Epithele typhae]|uniref:uncharacterized protein n=1 Tax=Epithele typhae TaxID=378194 RepID=UPI0020072241|nr:uncharacterized protein BXZ73DRAFT_52563 [Epithele typhae]KAH9919443.1 hypothetical protein BXZ73DRAFT_52563 [Epithele typhae]